MGVGEERLVDNGGVMGTVTVEGVGDGVEDKAEFH